MKSPQDTTLRNARASRARDAVLTARLRRLETRVRQLERAALSRQRAMERVAEIRRRLVGN